MILDTLLLVMKGDTDDLDASFQSAQGELKNLDGSLKKVEKSGNDAMSSLRGATMRVIGGLAAAVGASKMWGSAMSRINLDSQMLTISDRTGVAIERIDAFSRAVRRNGGELEGAISGIERFTSRVGRGIARPTGLAGSAFRELGIELQGLDGQARDSLDVMLDLAGALEGFDRADALNILRNIGVGDKGTIDLILQGQDAMESMMATQAEQGTLSRKNAEAAAKFQASQQKLKEVMEGFFRGPGMRLGIELLSDFFQALVNIAEAVSSDKTTQIGVFFGAIAAGLGVLTLMMGPIVPIVAGLTAIGGAIALLVEDFIIFREGGDSLIGMMVERFPLVGDIIDTTSWAIRRSIELLGTVFKTFGQALRAVWMGLTGNAEGFKDAIGKMFDGLKIILKAAIAPFEALWGAIKSGFEDVFLGVKRVMGELFDWLRESWQSLTGWISDSFSWIGRQFDKIRPSWLGGDASVEFSEAARHAGTSAWQAQSDAGVFSRMRAGVEAARAVDSSVIIGDVTIETQATDSKGISQSVGTDLTREIRRMQAQTSTDVSR